MTALSKLPGHVEAHLDDGRTVRASVVRLGRFINLRRVRGNRWHDPIGDLSYREAAALKEGLADLLATMTPES